MPLSVHFSRRTLSNRLDRCAGRPRARSPRAARRPLQGPDSPAHSRRRRPARPQPAQRSSRRRGPDERVVCGRRSALYCRAAVPTGARDPTTLHRGARDPALMDRALGCPPRPPRPRVEGYQRIGLPHDPRGGDRRRVHRRRAVEVRARARRVCPPQADQRVVGPVVHVGRAVPWRRRLPRSEVGHRDPARRQHPGGRSRRVLRSGHRGSGPRARRAPGEPLGGAARAAHGARRRSPGGHGRRGAIAELQPGLGLDPGLLVVELRVHLRLPAARPGGRGAGGAAVLHLGAPLLAAAGEGHKWLELRAFVLLWVVACAMAAPYPPFILDTSGLYSRPLADGLSFASGILATVVFWRRGGMRGVFRR